MSALRPVVAIVGRPNVGKSTLFNALAGSRIAIEADVPGVTRDRVLYPLELEHASLDLIDTGGIGIVDRQNLSDLVERQIDIALEEADALLFLVDCRDGIVPLDEAVAARLRKTGKPVFLVANKVDTQRLEDTLPSFHALGFGDPLPVSAKQIRNLSDLREALESLVAGLADGDAPPAPDLTAEDTLLKIAFVGRRNVGKSSLINQLCGAERVIVSDAPGTTRDSVDIRIERDGIRFVAIDTAGMRRRGQMDDVMEFYGHLRTERSIRRANVVVLMLDAMEEISRVDKKLGGFIVEEHKPCIVVLNKWDLVLDKNPNAAVEDFQSYLADRLPGLWFCRLAGISAKTGENVWSVIASAQELIRQASHEVKTAALNSALAKATQKRRPRPLRGKVGKIYYGTQCDVRPPTFLLFCNRPALFDPGYRRYLEGQLRESLGFPEIPLKLVFKTSSDKDVGRYGG